ncbi:DUF402 domain-containing protein [Kribbella deserti]|uniref:DUF402 domain-containing protein n=1 Tax=Kribbella deserti TaxID=1926257 RepID=A0ABV6QL91_9ACTN
MRRVRSVYRKFDGALHWHEWMAWLGEDEHGLWLGAPEGNECQRGDEPAVVMDQAHVVLFPRDQWWTASFNARPAKTEIYCDITSPVEFVSDELVTMVDLDLDVLRRRNGDVLIDDEDEFAEHQVKYGYPPEVIASAQASCDWLVANVVTTEPFLSAYKPYLDTARLIEW